MNAIDHLTACLQSIPSLPGADVVHVVVAVARALLEVYEMKCFNDAKVMMVHRAVEQVSRVLEVHLTPRPALVATYRREISDVQDAVRAAGEWVAQYARKSAMQKYFSANKERRNAELQRTAVMDSLNTFNLAMMTVNSGQLGEVHAAIVGGGAQVPAAAGQAAPIAAAGQAAPAPSLYPSALFPAAPVGGPVMYPSPPTAPIMEGYFAAEPVAMGLPVAAAAGGAAAPPPAYGHGQPAPPAALHAPFAPPVTLPPNSEQHAFIDAAKRRDWPAVQRMVTESPSVINVMPNGRWSALHHAAYTGNVELVTWLLARGADAEALTPQGQWPRDVAPAGSECRRLLTRPQRPRRLSFVLGELGVQAGVALQLHGGGGCGGGVTRREGGGTPLICSDEELRPYVLAGPEAVVARCTAEFGDNDEMKRLGFLTPAARVTLPAESRAAAGVPAAAAWFAFAHPPVGTADLSEQKLEELSESGMAEPWLHFLTLGGFCYFDDQRRLLAVNAVTAPEQEGVLGAAAHAHGGRTSLSFDGPLDADGRVLNALHKQSRLHDVTIPGLLAAGAARYAWLNPGEQAGGVPASIAAAWEHGAFLYAPPADDAGAPGGGAAQHAVIFRVVAAPPSPPPPPLAPTRSQSEGIADAMGVPVHQVREWRAVEAAMIIDGGGA